MALTTARHHPPLSVPLIEVDSPERILARRLVWCYFFLLLFEGAFRKWGFTSAFATPLLVIRDPFLIAILVLAYNGNFLPHNKFIQRLYGFVVAFCAASIFGDYFNVFTVMYGIRTNCLHFLLIFIIPKLFDRRDVVLVGKSCFICAIPISVVVANQFEAAPDDVINTAAGGVGTQMISSGGKVRASGTFTFVSGIMYFYAFIAAFVIHGFLHRKTFHILLLITATVCCLLVMVTAASRSVVGAVAQVLACLGFLALYRPQLYSGLFSLLVAVSILLFLLGQMKLFQEGLTILSLRFDEASGMGTGAGPIQEYFIRNYEVFKAPFTASFQAPLLGYGLGAGTNAGGALAGLGRLGLGESEWQRNIYESGPIIGNLYIIWRIGLFVAILKAALNSLRKYGNSLPVLLFGAAGPLVLMGQIGQPTTLGFAAFGAGLCLAATRIKRKKGDRDNAAVASKASHFS
ncbi:MAG: hypothetical protein CMI31_06480 [Opitutae bacterium]|nr:hypothetical protein [Opitutae bacterium]